MELQFQTQQKEVSIMTKQNKERTKTISKSKFLGVRQRPSGKWVAEIKNTTQKIRMWLGTFDTAEEAARAYDEAACLLRGSNTRTNFVDHIPPSSALSLKIKNLLIQKKSLRQKQQNPEEAIARDSAAATKTSSYSCTVASTFARHYKEGLEVFDNAYRPDLSNFSRGIDMGYPQFDHSSYIVNNAYDHELLSNQEVGFKMEKSTSDHQSTEMNEYWDNIHDCSSDAYWDLPLLCQTF